MMKHFKMYITTDNIIGEKTIDLDYRIRGKEVVVVSMFSNDIHRTLDDRFGIEEQAGNGWTFHKKGTDRPHGRRDRTNPV